jgi:hypothetical protein
MQLSFRIGIILAKIVYLDVFRMIGTIYIPFLCWMNLTNILKKFFLSYKKPRESSRIYNIRDASIVTSQPHY